MTKPKLKKNERQNGAPTNEKNEREKEMKIIKSLLIYLLKL
jgi:hypothetical protein